ncbi:LLM class F420-dependent oxidoreductase [bacterium]|nr:LLM class F420-dependent oxidoreductase [bacterium]
MKVGIPLFMLRHEQLVPIAEVAEEVGLESVWMPEHLVFPAVVRSRYPYAEDGTPPAIRPETPLLDPLIVLAQVAARTSRLRLGTNVYVLPLRHPIAVARMATTLDVLSGGRFSFGVGAGWLEEEFEAVGAEFSRRGALVRESVRAMKALWTEAEPTFRGRTWSFGPVRFEPKPVQKPHPPILVGGESEAAIRRAAAIGDGWYGVRHTPESVGPQVERLRAELAVAGRGGVPFEITVSTSAAALDRDALRRFEDAGVDRVVALPWSRAREAEDAVRRFAGRLLG